MDAKAIILSEMVVLYGTSLTREYSKQQENGWLLAVVSKPFLQRTIAITSLTALLLIIDELGLGYIAAVIGGMVLVSYLMGIGLRGQQDLLSVESQAIGAA